MQTLSEAKQLWVFDPKTLHIDPKLIKLNWANSQIGNWPQTPLGSSHSYPCSDAFPFLHFSAVKICKQCLQTASHSGGLCPESRPPGGASPLDPLGDSFPRHPRLGSTPSENCCRCHCLTDSARGHVTGSADWQRMKLSVIRTPRRTVGRQTSILDMQYLVVYGRDVAPCNPRSHRAVKWRRELWLLANAEFYRRQGTNYVTQPDSYYRSTDPPCHRRAECWMFVRRQAAIPLLNSCCQPGDGQGSESGWSNCLYISIKWTYYLINSN